MINKIFHFDLKSKPLSDKRLFKIYFEPYLFIENTLNFIFCDNVILIEL